MLNTNTASPEMREICYLRADNKEQAENRSQHIFGEYYHDEEKDGWYYLNPEVGVLLCAMMACEFGRITKENFQQFTFRIRIHEKLFGFFMWDGKESVPVPVEVIVKHIGLDTNISTITSAKFKNKMWARLQAETEGSIRGEIHEGEEATA